MSLRDFEASLIALSKDYDARLQRRGETAIAVPWRSEDDFEACFASLRSTMIADELRVALLDFGCGTGDLYRLALRAKNPAIDYVGVDAGERALGFARAKFPGGAFRRLDPSEREWGQLEADYCVVASLFTSKGPLSEQKMWDFVTTALTRLWVHTRKAVAFNVLWRPVDGGRDDRFYVSLDRLAQFLATLVGAAFVLRSNLEAGVCVCVVSKEPSSPSLSSGSDASAVCRPLLPKVAALTPRLHEIDRRRWYSNFGETVRDFETRLATHFGLASAACTTASSGTDALSAMLIAQAGRGSMERPLCLMPSYTFVGTPAAALNAGYQPYFVDIDPRTLAADPARLAGHPILSRCGAIIAVAPYGQPIRQREWEALSAASGVPVIIDAAAGFDSVGVNQAQTLGRLPVMISLHATKTLGVGEGGIILCRDEDVVRRCRRALNFGFFGSREAQVTGFNGKMSEYHAAVGLAALDAWPATKVGFTRVATAYRQAAQRCRIGEKIVVEEDWASSYALYRADSVIEAGAAERSLAENGIDYRLWYGDGCHLQPAYAGFGRDPLPVTQELTPRIIGLPMSVDLVRGAIDRVVETLARV
jgi:dTDP-4-amino-4,6-dideoxygalactose transaminase/SAM-dependent methyltransferase